MAIDLEEQKKESSSQGNNTILIILVILLILSFGLYFLISFYFLPQKEAQIIEVSEEISNMNKSAVGSNMAKLNEAKKQINDFKVIFENIPRTSNFFVNFDRFLQPNINYSNLKIDSSSRKVTVSGSAQSNHYLMQQISAWENEEFLENYELSNININENEEVTFNVVLTFKQSLFK